MPERQTLWQTYLINSDGSSAVIDTLTEWVQQFGAAVIPAMITKNIWGAGAGSATYNTFVKPPTIISRIKIARSIH